MALPAGDDTPSHFSPATAIDEVIERLGAIVEHGRERRERYGLFASLYHRTTLRVRHGLRSGRFEDAERMERLDVLFANLYLEAYARHRAGLAPTDAWSYAFARTAEPDHLVLQHLMLGMNAHINLDLGIAAGATCPGDGIVELRRDFFEINRVLAEMVDLVQEDLVAVSPLIGWVDRFAGRGDEALVRAFLNRSRRAAWRKARRLAQLTGAEHRSAVRAFDRHTARLAQRICPPPQAQPGWLRAVREREESDLEAIYEVLA